MQKQFLFIFLFLTACQALQAQTKRIAHRSHSGSDAHFEMIAAHGPFDDEGSNFGKAPDPVFRSVRLDTVVYLSDSVVVLKSREFYRTRPNGRKNLWRSVQDTVGHHALFSSGYSLKEIKRRMKEDGYYENPVSTVKFIGFKKPRKSSPEKAPKDKKDRNNAPAAQQKPFPGAQNQDHFIPVAGPDPKPSPFSPGLLTALLAVFAALTGWFSWLYLRLKRHEKMV